MGFRRYDVLIITALLDELEAVLALGEGGKTGWGTDKDRDGYPFHFRQIPREDGGEPLRIAAASFDEMGGDGTASRATALIKLLDPACLAMCGICAGKKQDVFLGDVIVASRVYRYDSGKVSASPRGEDGLRFEEFFHDPKAVNLMDQWRVDAAYLAREKEWTAGLEKTRPLSLEAQQQWLLRALLDHEKNGAVPPDEHPEREQSCPSLDLLWDRLRLPRYGLLVDTPGELALTGKGKGYAKEIARKYPKELPKNPPFRIRVGAIATGGAVQKDPELFSRLEKIERKTLGAEMEAVAIGRVGQVLGRPTLIVKAVSDYGDEDKDDAFREFAAHASAQVLLRLLLRNLEPVEQQFEDTPEPARRGSEPLHFERMGPERRDDLLSRVQTLARLRIEAKGETAEIVRIRAPAPFGGYLRVSKAEGPATSVYPVAAVEELSAGVFELFLDTIDARYRRNDPGILSVLVYGGTPPPNETVSKAAAKRVLLQSFTEYQGLIDFRGYLKRQVERLEKDPIYPPALYVTQRAVLQADAGEASTMDALGELSTLLASPHPRFILVLGDFGTGKTFLLHELARRLAKAGGLLVPVLIEMRTLEKAQELDSLVVQHMAKAGMERIDLPAFHHMLAHGRITLLFDGFDELALRVSYKRAVEHFSTLIQASQEDAKIVITSRTQHFYSDQQVKSALGEQASSQRGYRLVRLQRFTQEQVRSFLENRLGDREKAAGRMKLLAEVKDLMGLAENPRMLGFIADIPEEKLLEARARDKEITSASLYEMLLNQWLQHEFDRAHPRGGPPGLDLKQRWSAATGLAMRLWQQLERSINILELPADLTAAVKALAEHNISPEEVQHQVGSGTLLVRDEGNNFSFIHQSIMEWLVAKAVAQELREGGAAKALGVQELSPLMADFVWGLAGRQEAEQWARRALEEDASSNAHKNALTVLKQLGIKASGGLKLAGQDLSGKDFSGQDLSDSDFTGAILTGAKLVGTNLTGAIFVRAVLRGADLSRATLTRADLRSADMSGARLLGASAIGAQFEKATLRQAKLIRAELDPSAFEQLGERALFGAAGADAVQATPMVSSVFSCQYVAISPDGRLLASGHGHEIRLWALETGSMLRVLKQQQGDVQGVCFSPDGGMLASGCADATVRLWDVSTGTEHRVLEGHGQRVWSVSFSPSGEMLASGSADATVRLWDVATGTERRVFKGHSQRVWNVSFSPDGGTLASGSDDTTVRLWDVATGTQRRVLRGHGQGVLNVSFSPDGGMLASGSWDATVRLWDVATGTERRLLRGHQRFSSVRFSPDGGTLASGSADSTVRLWDVATGTERRVLRGHAHAVFGVSFSPDGSTLASSSADTTVRLWDVATGQERRVLKGHARSVLSVSFSPDGRTLASGSDGATTRLWDVATGQERRVFEGHGQSALSVGFSPDGGMLASCFNDATVYLWDMATGQERRILAGQGPGVLSVSFSPSGGMLALSSDDATVRLWDVATGQQRPALTGHAQAVLSVSFSPDGGTLASGSADATVRLWDVSTGYQRRVLKGHSQSVLCVSFSPDGGKLASGSADATARLWDVSSGQRRTVLKGHAQRVLSVGFSPDGGMLASGSADTTVRLWDVATGQERRVLKGHTQGVSSVSFSPDGGTLASGSADATVRLWDVTTGECLAVLVSLDEGWVAFTPDGRYRYSGNLGAAFWHAIGLCRFEPGELEPYLPLQVAEHEPLYRLPTRASTNQ